MGEAGEEANPLLLNAWEAGGPNDPTVAFKALNEQLHEVKDELSPWGWRAYHTEFTDRQNAERRLRALASLPGSGSEPSDGVIKGTPMWQERIDHLLLVEHLKTKIMAAHTKFNDASELFLKSHSWLVSDYHLADLFVKFITTVPESAHDRVDYLQAQLEQSRKETIKIRNDFEDYVERQRQNRVDWVKRTLDHQKRRNARTLKDDIMITWSYGGQHIQLSDLTKRNESLQTRCLELELGTAEQAEFLKESQRRWIEDKTALTKEKNEYYKKWQKMVKAHEQAMADLKRSEGTAEGQRLMILTLSSEKAQLEQQVESLEEQVRVMAKQLAELRDELAKIRQDVKRLTGQLKETEAVLVDTRLEGERVEAEKKELEARLDDAAVMEVTLREEIFRWKAEHSASEERCRILRGEKSAGEQRERGLEAYRDQLLGNIDDLKAEVQRTIKECKDEIHRTKMKARQEIEEFKNRELVRVKEDFQKKTDVIVRRNDLLEKEVKQGDTLGPHLATLNPIGADESKLCPVCRRVIVYEGAVRG